MAPSHWDAWGFSGNRTISRAEPNSTPERALDLLLEKARLIHGEQNWEDWFFEVREFGTQSRRLLRFRWKEGAWLPVTGTERNKP
jgi:hypothetical protein